VRPADQGPRFFEEFLDPARRSPEAVEGFDGTAWWSDTGAVRVRYPRSAGDGSDGRVLLGGDEPRAHVRATQLTLPDGERARLTTDQGFVQLSAQGSLRIEGELARRVEEGASARASGESVAEWQARVRASGDVWGTPSMRAAIEASTTLAELCELARGEGSAWTVLVAGGDLVVSGRIEVDGPLLLAAGGWIRVTGEVEAREIWTASEGGGRFQPHPYPAQLAFESPSENPLREPLHLAVLSAPLRPPRGVQRWGLPRVEGRDGAGRFEVRFLGEREAADGSLLRVGPVSDPRLLEGCESVQLWIELRMEPGTVWEPPVVDHIELSWFEGASSAEGR